MILILIGVVGTCRVTSVVDRFAMLNLVVLLLVAILLVVFVLVPFVLALVLLQGKMTIDIEKRLRCW